MIIRKFSTNISRTINESEIAKFSKISNEWWNPKSNKGAGPLHQINPIRIEFIRNFVFPHFNINKNISETSKPFKGLSFADVGCGGGILSESLCRLGANVTSIDPSKENIEIALNHAKKDNETRKIKYQCKSAEQLMDEGLQFDVVCSLEVIEHVKNKSDFVTTLTNLIKPKGLIFLSTLNRTILSYVLSIIIAENILGILPKGTHEWNNYVRPQELCQYLDKNGIHTKKISGIVGDPYITGWRLMDDYTDVNYILCGIKR